MGRPRLRKAAGPALTPRAIAHRGLRLAHRRLYSRRALGPRERNLKGINFLGTLEALEREHGRDVRERVERGLDGDVGESLRSGALVANGWYPAAWYRALLARIVKETGGDEQTIRRLSNAAVSADMKTLFRIVKLFLTPERALQQSMRISSRYIDGGEIEVVKVGKGHIHYRFREYHGYDRLMWWDFIGGVEAVLENIGARDLNVRIVSGGGDGDHHLEIVMRWNV